jgi:hypothetical protein
MVLGSESPSEKEDRLQKREQRLERQHERVKEMRQLPKEGGGGGPSMGSSNKLTQYISEHRWEFAIGLIATVLVGYVFFRAQSGSAGTSTTVGSTNAASGGSANNQGSLAAAGYDTSGVAYALTQESQQLTDLQNQLINLPAQGPAGTPGSPGPSTGTVVPAKWSLPPIFGAGTKVFQNSTGAWMATTTSGQSYTLLGPKSAPGQGIFAQGTQIEKGGSGRYWYILPGQYEQALVPTNGYTGNVLGVSTLPSGIVAVNTPQNPGTPNA